MNKLVNPTEQPHGNSGQDVVLAADNGVPPAGEDHIAANMQVLRQRFPDLYNQLLHRVESDCNGISVRDTVDGAALWCGETPLDHPDKPKAAASAWVKRSLNDGRIAKAERIYVLGLGAGYHLEELLSTSSVPISCCEPDFRVFQRAIAARNLVSVFTRLERLIVGRPLYSTDIASGAELLVRPQSAVLNGSDVETTRVSIYSKRGLRELRPKIGVLGPFHGGPLPMLGYCTQALQRLDQRVRPIDVSAFNGGFMGVEQLLKDPARQKQIRAQYVEVVSSMLLESLNEKPIDILICMAQAPISGRALSELRSRGVVTVLWFVEDYLRFTYWREMAKYYDFIFTIQKGECIEKIKAAGAGEVHYLPTACDPFVHTPLELTEADRTKWGSPISFVGAGYHNRVQMFASLADAPFKIWGSEWPSAKPFDRLVQEDARRITPQEYVKIFNATEINLNLHSSSERDGIDPGGDFINPRTFELASAGAFQLCDERLLLPEEFESGKEIITFTSLQDMKDKIAYYLAHPEERRLVCERARARALRDHTYDRRLEQMLETVYASKYELLKQRESHSPWVEVIRRAEVDPELKGRCERAYRRGEEPILDGLIADIVTGRGKLSETEQKLLFMHHVRNQTIRIQRDEAGSNK